MTQSLKLQAVSAEGMCVSKPTTTTTNSDFAVRQFHTFSWGKLAIHACLADVPESAEQRSERVDQAAQTNDWTSFQIRL